MAIVLGSGTSRPASVVYYDGEEFQLSAGTRMQLRDNETGEIVNRLDEIVPAGKVWNVSVYVSVIETDV